MQRSKRKKERTVIGELQMAFDGYGFVMPEEKGLSDIFIPAPHIGDALNKDRVEVTMQPGRAGKLEGRIVRVLERGIRRVVGRYELRGKGGIVVTDEFRVGKRVMVAAAHSNGARHNEIVVVEITQYPSGKNPIMGEVVQRLGRRGSDEIELNILIARHGISEEFPKNVVDEADRVSKNLGGEDKNRKDLTHLPFTTIDGEDAKDFDDAVCAKVENENVRVWISIADVAHFVREGSILDKEASKRATSVYLPGMCVPMLPEELSTNICSLIPGETRFTFTAEFIVHPDGDISNQKFYKSVIKSKYRMTYTEAFEFLANGRRMPADNDVHVSLENLYRASGYIRKKRERAGSIDFDLPEPQIVLDLTGKPESIIKANRNLAHMLIEDLMIAANEAVATYLSQKRYQCVYRVHDQPDIDKLLELKILLNNLGHRVKIGQNPTSKMLSKIVKLVEGRPEEKLINMMLLRSMAQAVYSTNNIGHFGLASGCYCHFTSPIRRYPDLLVHRLLSDATGFERQRQVHIRNHLKREAEHSSKMERRAMEAERESKKLFSAIFMRDHIGETYEGMISHVAKKGLFVELVDYFVEGMIEVIDLPGDHFRFDPKTYAFIGRKSGKSFRIGDRIKVKVKDVSIEERRIYFELS